MAASFRGGLPLFAFKGIQVRVHWSFLALPAFIIISGLADGIPWSGVLQQVGFILIVFACVVLHEYGHALMALRYGVRTRDITLLPIGGVASLERMPEDPRQEFWITLAGPLVNLVIAGLAFTAMAIMGLTWLFADVDPSQGWTGVLGFLVTANLGLFLFNLIPAFPMDGGRILRSALSMRMPRVKATRIATGIGRVLAVGFVIYGLFTGQFFTAIIGVFIFMAAGAEARQVGQLNELAGVTVREVMRSRYWTIPGPTPVHEAVNGLLAGGDHAAVVMDVMGYTGVVDRKELWDLVGRGMKDMTMRQLPLRRPDPLSTTMDVREALAALQRSGSLLIPVMEGNDIVGVFEMDNVNEFLQLRHAQANWRPDQQA
ncbi:MAG: site-2 protease family protein [Flavobacteriales bacterium]|jgi:Zn-dependent protease|nr:site-2 protease family protein [Flavobacteriales bacterium]MBP7449907.1 site-2 protease family protein [Flavobacteriales bacterium]HOZ39558.1 site-2 protease family protein [Flavobacteriales bacterium]